MKWEEVALKNIERAFGNLKIMWKFVSCPIEIWSLTDIAIRILTVLILHNVVVSDHVMDDMNMQYNPANLVENFGNFQMATLTQTAPEVEVVVEHTTPQSFCDVVAVSGHWKPLANEAEHSRLHSEFMRKIN